MILQLLKVFSQTVWQVYVATAGNDPGTDKEIIRTHLALTPGNYYLNAIKTLSLVHRSWLPTTRYLAYVKVAFIPKSMDHASRMLEHLKTHLPPAPVHSDDFVPTQQSQRASCRTLFIGIIKVETYHAHAIGLELFQLMGHSLRTLELRGLAGSFWGPREALTATLTNVPFLPRLRQLKVLDVGTWTLMAYLCAIWKGDGKAGPSGLVVHHDFELSRERDLLSVPIDILAKIAPSSNTDDIFGSLILGERAWATHEFLGIADTCLASNEAPIPGEDNRRPPLELYISRRSQVGEFILTLPKAKMLMNVLKRSVQTVDVWLKDQEEIGSKLANVIASWGWEHHIDRNVADGETTHSLLHEF
ncbi:hypothetical protein M407DRAFT_217793 [Tulasnella calospora MUT 4182]|uniref:Uncharacterized protein n=1 Tax=Tulasnella calospora MUT 4182 TaxID=1051891 RepID=A0A0C3LCV0_9AGAM|nr:hypothetical protein M407DRAFT_217793 [Tulasnella calospora MUT 4182]